MDYKNLSKIKHIYKIYRSPNNYWHCEKYPVIYVNKKYLYYKIGADEELVSKRIDYIQDSFIISNPVQGFL